ncbi:MAG: ABC transporter substrate-binding protein [Dehalococcoidia bacterium]
MASFLRLVVAALLALSLAACAAPTAPTGGPSVGTAARTDGPVLPAMVQDLDGRTVTITNVDRIVSLNGDVTEIIFALGLGDRIVGVDTSATYPAEPIASLPRIGYQRTLNAEGILSLGPSLVIGNDKAGPPAVLDQLRATGIAVAIGVSGETIDTPIQKIRFVAAALGVPQRGEVLVETLNQDMAAVGRYLSSQSTVRKPRVLFVLLRGTTVQSIAGTGTSGDAVIRAAGGINAAGELGLEGNKPLSQEILVTAQPDALLFLDAGLESVGGIDGLLAANPAIAATPAGRDRRFISFEDQYLQGLGPRTGKAVNDLAHALYAPSR